MLNFSLYSSYDIEIRQQPVRAKMSIINERGTHINYKLHEAN